MEENNAIGSCYASEAREVIEVIIDLKGSSGREELGTGPYSL